MKSYGQILDTSYAATTTLLSEHISVDPERSKGATIHVYSTQDGTATVYYVDEDANERALDSGQAVTASSLLTFDINYAIPHFYVAFAPTAATAGTVKISAYPELS